MKFRIVKFSSVKNNGEIDIYYKIQKKFLFWFFDYITKTHYFTNYSYNSKLYASACITRRLLLFDSEDKAQQFLIRIKNLFSEIYKGCLIEQAFNDDNLKDVYINYSKSEVSDGIFGYEFSYDLSELKQMIDIRKNKNLIKKVCFYK